MKVQCPNCGYDFDLRKANESKVLRMLKKGPKRYNQVAFATGFSPRTVNKILASLTARQKIIRRVDTSVSPFAVWYSLP